jgi:hypothetical protein
MLKTTSLHVVVLVAILIAILSCHEQVTSPVADESAYFPLEVGNFWIYQVTTETYATAQTPIKRSYQVQQKLSRSYPLNGLLVFVIDESTRPNDKSPWILKSIHTVYKNQLEVVVQNDNAPVVKLAFPIAAVTSWNTNLYNTRPLVLLRYENAGRPFSVGKFNFDDTVSVLGSNDSTLVGQEKYLRVYARSTGCVYREDRSLAFCQASSDCLGNSVVESGTIEKWELIASNQLP